MFSIKQYNVMTCLVMKIQRHKCLKLVT